MTPKLTTYGPLTISGSLKPRYSKFFSSTAINLIGLKLSILPFRCPNTQTCVKTEIEPLNAFWTPFTLLKELQQGIYDAKYNLSTN